MAKTAVIIGAGPAGLTAAFELLTRTDIKPIVLERSQALGGLSQTVNHHGNRIDIGGHRFFSKSDRVMDWWLAQLPLAAADGGAVITYHQRSQPLPAGTAAEGEAVMLLRPRQSRIYFMRQFFDYPIRLNLRTLRQLGPWRVLRIALSYLRASLFPPRRVDNLEQFFISRFGRELYRIFFQSYTEKVWGLPCSQIDAEWGAQRIKGLSVRAALLHALRRCLPARYRPPVETSLIERFLYPRLGPGQLWEQVAERVRARGGEILTGFEADTVLAQPDRVTAVEAHNEAGARRHFAADYVFSTMAIKDLAHALRPAPPPPVQPLAEGLLYRDFITVGLLLRRLTLPGPVSDNWIYIQEPGVQAGRLQIFNNWSPAMVRDPATVWIGVEYFCNDTDPVWSLDDAAMAALAERELEQIGVLARADVLDRTVVRMTKAYPAYFGSAYARFDELRAYFDGFENLFLVGRNGMHKYNNQDHSMLTAMTAVDNILAGRRDKANLWAVNTEMDYHEQSRPETGASSRAAGAGAL